MKIALQVGAPEQKLLNAFMQDLSETDLQVKAENNLLKKHDGIVAAYDSERLVGLGEWVNAGTMEPPELQFYIAPGYEGRGLRDHMTKLLLPKHKRNVS